MAIRGGGKVTSSEVKEALLLNKSDILRREVVDGSNESLYYANEESDLNLWTGVPLQKSFEKVDVHTNIMM